jgi:hypothetical protein
MHGITDADVKGAPSPAEAARQALAFVGDATIVGHSVGFDIAFLWQGAEAGDRPVPVRPLYELRTQLVNSSKHVQLMTATTPLAARGAVEMARAVAGGADALRARPVLSSFQVSLSPLTFDGDALDAALVYAEAGRPLVAPAALTVVRRDKAGHVHYHLLASSPA